MQTSFEIKQFYLRIAIKTKINFWVLFQNKNYKYKSFLLNINSIINLKGGT